MNDDLDLMLAEENAVAEIQSMAVRLLRAKKITQSELASRMKVSPSYVSQLLASDEPQNLSVKKAANLFFHLGEELAFTCAGVEALDAEAYAKKRRQKQLFTSYRQQAAWTACNSNLTDDELDELAVA